MNRRDQWLRVADVHRPEHWAARSTWRLLSEWVPLRAHGCVTAWQFCTRAYR